MTNNEQIVALLAVLAQQSGEQVAPFRIEFTSQRLIELNQPSQVITALTKLIETSRRFPTVGEVKAEMGISTPTARDEALAIADATIAVLSKFGWIQPGYAVGARARELAAGPAVWELIARQGGWNAALERMGENQMAFRAQMRDLAETYLKTGVIQRGQIPEKILGQLEAIGLAQAEGIGLLGDAH